MKKLVIAAAAMAASMAYAEVASSIVGYNTVSVNAGETITLAVQFSDVASGGSIPVKNLLTIANPVGSTSASASADQIWQYTPDGGWIKYYYYKRGSTEKWCVSGTTAEISDSVVFNVGTAFFFVRASGTASSATTLTLAGGVTPLSDTPSYSVAKGATAMMSYPWPMGLTIKNFNNYNQSGGVGSTSASASADQIWRYNATDGWTKYYFYKRGSTEKWCLSGSTTEISADEIIPAGEGFFFVRASGNASSDATIRFTAE